MRLPYLIIMSLLCCLPLRAQETEINQSIYFETAKDQLDAVAQQSLDSLIEILKLKKNYRIVIQGNTDNVGDSSFNAALSQRRVLSCKNYFLSKGIPDSLFTTAALGELKPVASNQSESGKQKNRRVDISIIPVAQAALPSILDLYKQTELPKQEFTIDPSRDTTIRGMNGTLIRIPANAFKTNKNCPPKSVRIQLKEALTFSDMLLENLNTTSKGRILETDGMVFVEALDCNKFPPVGASYQLKNGVGSVELDVTDAVGTAYPH